MFIFSIYIIPCLAFMSFECHLVLIPKINLIPRSVSELNHSPTSIHDEGQVTGGDRGRLQRHEERAEADREQDQRAAAGPQRAQDSHRDSGRGGWGQKVF